MCRWLDFVNCCLNVFACVPTTIDSVSQSWRMYVHTLYTCPCEIMCQWHLMPDHNLQTDTSHFSLCKRGCSWKDRAGTWSIVCVYVYGLLFLQGICACRSAWEVSGVWMPLYSCWMPGSMKKYTYIPVCTQASFQHCPDVESSWCPNLLYANWFSVSQFSALDHVHPQVLAPQRWGSPL